jgi:catechol 2,3-dioxygenase-like lactoylglutathione lyase family enzyme
MLMHRRRRAITMINHVSIGVRDIATAKAFYDAVLKPIGYSCLNASESSLGYGNASVAFWISPSASPVPHDPHSGLHFCFTAPTRTSVDAFHLAAIRHGGRDNGKPGLRADYGADYYAAFIVDPDGYRIEAYCDKAA